MPAKAKTTGAPKKKRARSEHYVNNKEFLYAIVQYKADVKEAEEKGDPKPRITNYLGECFVKIATHLSYKPNFVNLYVQRGHDIRWHRKLRSVYT